MAIDVVSKYNLDMSGTTDNASKLQQLYADVNALYQSKKCLPRLMFSEGILAFSSWPNLAFNHLELEAEGQCYLKHIGSGDAITFDGNGQTGQGIFDVRFENFNIVPGANTANTLTLRCFHHSYVDVAVHGAGVNCAAIAMQFNVCTEVRPKISGLESYLDSVQFGFPAFNANCVGVFLDAYPVGSPNRTTASTLRNIIIESLDQGIHVAGSDLCSYYDGTIEAGNIGIFLDGDCRPGSHKFINVEMEANKVDVVATAGAHNNRWVYCGKPGLTSDLGGSTIKDIIPANVIHSTEDWFW